MATLVNEPPTPFSSTLTLTAAELAIVRDALNQYIVNNDPGRTGRASIPGVLETARDILVAMNHPAQGSA